MKHFLEQAGKLAGALLAVAAVLGGLSGWGKAWWDYFVKQPDIVPLELRVIGTEYDRVFEQRTRLEYLEKNSETGLNVEDYKKLQALTKKEVELENELAETKEKLK